MREGGRVVTLVEFLLARLADDEEIAQAATSGPWRVEEAGDSTYGGWWYIAADALRYSYVAGSGYEGGGVSSEQDATHMARWDPARVLAECAAKRAIAKKHQPRGVQGGPPYRWTCAFCDRAPVPWDAYLEWPCETGRLLAAPYADHPDFDQAWRV